MVGPPTYEVEGLLLLNEGLLGYVRRSRTNWRAFAQLLLITTFYKENIWLSVPAYLHTQESDSDKGATCTLPRAMTPYHMS
jgi:hypothetical protein